MVETEKEIMDTVRSRQKRWLGYILRHDSLLRITLEGQIQGKKAYGRQQQQQYLFAIDGCKPEGHKPIRAGSNAHQSF